MQICFPLGFRWSQPTTAVYSWHELSNIVNSALCNGNFRRFFSLVLYTNSCSSFIYRLAVVALNGLRSCCRAGMAMALTVTNSLVNQSAALTQYYLLSVPFSVFHWTDLRKTVRPASVSGCFKPKRLSHTVMKLYKDMYGFAAAYTCHHGYRFAEGGSVRTNVCIDGVWIIDIPDCEG